MFSQWAVEVLKRLNARVRPKIPLANPVRFVADLLFAIAVFFCFNRRPIFNYNASFWTQLLYVVQLIKVVYTLRFLLVELVYRELRTFFCFISPVVSKLSIVRKWQTADPCVLKVVNLAFFLLFIFLNIAIACSIEWVAHSFWAWLKDSRRYGRSMLYLPKPLGFACGSKKRRHRRSARYRVRGRPRSTSCTRCPCTRPFLRFWPKTGSGARCVHPSGEGSSKASTADPLRQGYCSFITKTTRSGKNY